MSFVRIYQGRVLRVYEMPPQRNTGLEIEKRLKKKELQRFHDLFTDAVNYYLLAIGALVRGNEDPSLKNFVGRLEECWEPYVKKGGCYEGLRSTLARYFSISSDMTFNDGCELILAKEGEECLQEVYHLSGESLLFWRW